MTTIFNEAFETQSLDLLLTALSKAQQEMEIALNDSNNPFFKSKYANLTSIVKSSRPYLSKHGLCVLQRIISSQDGKSYLYTKLGHSSGQWAESKTLINPPKNDIQSYGSYITYLRRYCYAAIVGVVTDDNLDDDGESVMERPSHSYISQEQLLILEKSIGEDKDLLERILKANEIDSLSQVNLKNFNLILRGINSYKANKYSETQQKSKKTKEEVNA